MPNLEVLRGRWRKTKRLAGLRAFLHKLPYWMLWAAFISTFNDLIRSMGSWRDVPKGLDSSFGWFFYPTLAGGTLMLVAIAFSQGLTSKQYQREVARNSRSRDVEFSQGMSERLSVIMHRISALLELPEDAEGIRILKDEAQERLFPYVVEKDRRPVIMVPVAFLRQMRADNEAATAVLAHEIAHIAQADYKAWAKLTIFARHLCSWWWPASLLFCFALNPVSSFAHQNYVALLEQRAAVVPTTQVPPFDLVSDLLSGLVPLIWFAVVFTSIVAMRRRAEKCADLGGASVTGADAMIRAIDWLQPEREGLLTIHPSPLRRKRFLRRLARYEGKETNHERVGSHS